MGCSLTKPQPDIAANLPVCSEEAEEQVRVLHATSRNAPSTVLCESDKS